MNNLEFIQQDNDEQDHKVSKAPKKPGGTFASMNLSRPILKAVERKGYKLATPIQRKCIPSIMSGRDLVAMARTGSGKSAAFLLPLIDKLKIRQPKADIRALIISPTRELAMQTLKFTREFTKYTNLISKLIVGGESISKDFETVTSSPDILIATPGRLAHVLVEMKYKFNELEIVVFDEADRLFEPGFKEMEQVNEICSRMPDSKQTLLFSATMPQRLADFAKLGLKNPLFIRLDVETNLSETLKSIHLHCNQHDKFAVLSHLLKNFVDKEQMIVVFMPTRHHIEYAKILLSKARIDCCYVYSSMDPEARRINIDRFTKKNCRVMLVTDIAARGVDIPLLDIVINFNFPFKPKLYVHRVGRVARAGRFGSAISIISHDELPYLHTLHLFFGEPITVAANLNSDQLNLSSGELSKLPDKVLGSIPQSILDEENEILDRWLQHDDELSSMVKVCENAMKPYLKTRDPPTPASVKASKEIHRKVIGIHPLFSMISKNHMDQDGPEQAANDQSHTNMLDRIKSYKPQATIFEVGHIKGNNRTEAFGVMQKKRQYHDKIAQKRAYVDTDEEDDSDMDDKPEESLCLNNNHKNNFEDSRFYLKYQPDDYAKEKGLEISKKNSFDNELKRATMDLVADDENQLKSQRHQMMWDRKKKKYVKAEQLLGESDKKTKKIKTECGALISASYQSGLYEKWKNKSKVDHRLSDDGENSDTNNNENKKKGKISFAKLRSKLQPAKRRRELKNPEEILKERGIKEKREAILRLKTQHKAQRNAQRGGGSKGNSAGKSKSGNKSEGKRGKGSSQGGSKSNKRRGGVKKQPQVQPQKMKGYRPPKFGAGAGRRRK